MPAFEITFAGFLVSFLAMRVSPIASNSIVPECFQKQVESGLFEFHIGVNSLAGYLRRLGGLAKRQRLRGLLDFLLSHKRSSFRFEF
jgi:hypothetical protein